MPSLLISESILENLEARRKRRAEKDSHTGETRSASGAGRNPVITQCASAIEQAIRESIRSSFARWESELVPQIEKAARQGDAAPLPVAPTEAGPVRGPSPSPAFPITPAPQAQHAASPSAKPPVTKADRPPPESNHFPKAPPTASGGLPPSGGSPQGPGKGPGGESWNDLVKAVEELRDEWDRETFDACFAPSRTKSGSKTEIVRKPASTKRAIHSAAPPAAATVKPAPAQGRSPQPSGAEPHCADTRQSKDEPPAIAAPATRQAPEVQNEMTAPQGSSIQEEKLREAIGLDSEELTLKIDQLILLVRNSLDQRAPGKSSQLPRDLSSTIAREVVGRLKETLPALKMGPEAPTQVPKPAPVEDAKIPIGDIAAMIDQINGVNGQ